jgi:hypothetical protein
MAQTFNILEFEKNHELNRYFAKIEMDGEIGKYEIRTNANIKYLGWMTNPKFRLSILDGLDMPFNGEFPYLKIEGLDGTGERKEGVLLEAFYDFIRTECSEDLTDKCSL